jgi:hypothetical protein
MSLDWCNSGKANLIWRVWYLIAWTLLIWLFQWVLDNDFTVKLGTWSSKTFYLLVEPKKVYIYIFCIIPKKETTLAQDLAISQSVRLRLWQVHDCRSGFAIHPPALLQEQPVVLLLLDGALVSWSLAMDECGGYEDIRGSGQRSVILYVHGRTGLYCTSMPCLSLSICPPLWSGACPSLL